MVFKPTDEVKISKMERGKNHRMNHSKMCFACGKEVPRRDLRYFIPTMKTYHSDINKCTNKKAHPHELRKHSPIFEKELGPTTNYDEIVKQLKEFITDDDVFTNMFKFFGKAASVRLEPYQSIALGELMKANGLESVQDI